MSSLQGSGKSLKKIFLNVVMLADRGELDLYAPIADYWPGFADNGKAGFTITNLLSHSAGLPAFSRHFSAEELCGYVTFFGAGFDADA